MSVCIEGDALDVAHELAHKEAMQGGGQFYRRFTCFFHWFVVKKISKAPHSHKRFDLEMQTSMGCKHDCLDQWNQVVPGLAMCFTRP